MVEVIVVDAHPIIRSGIQLLLSQHPTIHFAGGEASIREGLKLVESTHASVIILNLPLPALSGFQQLHQLRQSYPRLGIIVLSALDESIYAESCFRSGANAFLSKRAPLENMLAAIEQVARGEMYCSDELKAHLIKRAATGRPHESADPTASLSHAESQVFEMIGEGMTTQQIAKALGVNTKTIETYRTRMKQKLGFRSGTQLTHFAMMQTLGQKLSKAVPAARENDGLTSD